VEVVSTFAVVIMIFDDDLLLNIFLARQEHIEGDCGGCLTLTSTSSIEQLQQNRNPASKRPEMYLGFIIRFFVSDANVLPKHRHRL
jgi:hypothetical protein